MPRELTEQEQKIQADIEARSVRRAILVILNNGLQIVGALSDEAKVRELRMALCSGKRFVYLDPEGSDPQVVNTDSIVFVQEITVGTAMQIMETMREQMRAQQQAGVKAFPPPIRVPGAQAG